MCTINFCREFWPRIWARRPRACPLFETPTENPTFQECGKWAWDTNASGKNSLKKSGQCKNAKSVSIWVRGRHLESSEAWGESNGRRERGNIFSPLPPINFQLTSACPPWLLFVLRSFIAFLVQDDDWLAIQPRRENDTLLGGVERPGCMQYT